MALHQWLWGAVPVAIALVAVWATQRSSSSSSSDPAPSTAHAAVHVLTFANDGDTELPLGKLREGGVPTLLRNTVVERWPARSWSLALWAQKLGTLQGVYNHTRPLFGPYYDASKPLAPVARNPNPYQANASVPAQLLLFPDRRLATGPPGFLYLSQEVASFSFRLYGAFEPLDPLLGVKPERFSLNLWLGEPGVEAHAHYDGYHNLYAQLYGHKRFRLVSPAAWRHLGVYPFLHPCHAQCLANRSVLDA
jgi:hypothetical protein